MAESGGRPLDEFNRPEIVFKLIRGDAAEFERLCRKAYRVLPSIISRLFGDADLKYHDVEEIVSDTLLATSKAVRHFKPGKAKLTTWLIDIAINTTRNHLKARSRKKRTPPREADADAPDDSVAAEASAKKKGGKKSKREPILPKIQKQFEHLPQKERREKQSQAFWSLDDKSRAILWVESSGRSDEANADSLKITVNNYRVRRARALEKLLAAAKKITAP